MYRFSVDSEPGGRSAKRRETGFAWFSGELFIDEKGHETKPSVVIFAEHPRLASSC
jgi:hypothetical protein